MCEVEEYCVSPNIINEVVFADFQSVVKCKKSNDRESRPKNVERFRWKFGAVHLHEQFRAGIPEEEKEDKKPRSKKSSYPFCA